MYRIGGDEFVVILKGADYDERLNLLEDLKHQLEESYSQENVEPWEKYSASVGMAEFASDDSTVELVFKRADRALYDSKSRGKNCYSIYRSSLIGRSISVASTRDPQPAARISDQISFIDAQDALYVY